MQAKECKHVQNVKIDFEKMERMLEVPASIRYSNALYAETHWIVTICMTGIVILCAYHNTMISTG